MFFTTQRVSSASEDPAWLNCPSHRAYLRLKGKIFVQSRCTMFIIATPAMNYATNNLQSNRRTFLLQHHLCSFRILMIHVELSAWRRKYLRKQSWKYFHLITQHETFFLREDSKLIFWNFISKDIKNKRGKLLTTTKICSGKKMFKFISLKEKVFGCRVI